MDKSLRGSTREGSPGGGPSDGAAVDGEGRAALALGVLLHLGGHVDRLPVVGELPATGRRDADGDRDEAEPLQLALAILDLDVSTFQVFTVVEALDLLIEALADPRRGDV